MTNPIVAAVIAARTSCGLALHFNIPGRPDTFICYAKDDAQKTAWLSKAIDAGWERMQ